MGSILRAHCDCGYNADDLLLGGGRMDFTTNCNFPYYCEDCSILFEANAFEETVICPKCHKDQAYSYDTKKACGSAGEKIVFDWNVMSQIGRTLVLTDGSYICPSCHKFRLRFFESGFWD